MPQRHKVPLRPDNTIQTDPHDIIYDFSLLPFSFVIMAPTASNTIALSIRRNNYPLAVLFTSVCVGFFLLQFNVSKMLNKKLNGKIWVNVNMWFLHTILPVGVIYQLSDFITPQFTLIMYTVVVLSSLLMFYLFVIDDLVMCWKIWGDREDDHNQSLELNSNSVLIWEKA